MSNAPTTSAPITSHLIHPAPVRRSSMALKGISTLASRCCRQLIEAGREHRRVTLGDQRAVAAAGVGTRQARYARQLARDRQPGSRQKTARDFAKRGLAADATPEGVGKTSDAKRPDVGELRLVVDLAGDDEHGRLQLVERDVEGLAILDTGFVAQIRRRHLPLVTKHLQD